MKWHGRSRKEIGHGGVSTSVSFGGGTAGKLAVPPELRQLAVQYAASAVGLSRRQIAAVLGLNEATLIRWQRSEPGTRCAPAALHEVVVVDQEGRNQPVLVMPSGVRVEGLSVDELVSVLEALG